MQKKKEECSAFLISSFALRASALLFSAALFAAALSVGDVRAEDSAQPQASEELPPLEEKGLQIARDVRESRRGFVGETADIELILINAAGDQITRRMSSQTIEVEGDGDRSLITFEWPPDVEDTQLLTWRHLEGSDDQWLYLPSIQRVKRISSRNKSGSFMGSEFSYEDIGSQEVEQFDYKFLREEELDGRATWVIERYPVDRLSGYSKQIVWYDQEYMAPLRIDYFDRKEELLKVSSFSDYEQFQEWWRAQLIEMENVQTRKVSRLVWKERQLGQEIESRAFEPTSLGD